MNVDQFFSISSKKFSTVTNNLGGLPTICLYLLIKIANIFAFQDIEIQKTTAIPNFHSRGQFSALNQSSLQKGDTNARITTNDTANIASRYVKNSVSVILSDFMMVLVMRQGFASSPRNRVIMYSSPPYGFQKKYDPMRTTMT